MDELLAGLLLAIAELFADILAEVLLEMILEVITSLLARVFGKFFDAIFAYGPYFTAATVTALGIVSGYLSLMVFPHRLIHLSKLHGVSLLISPLLTGLVMFQIGRMLRDRGRRTTRIESFTYGYIFAFAVALIRFVSVR